MSGPYQGRDLSNCSVARLWVAINCGDLDMLAVIPIARQEGVSPMPQSVSYCNIVTVCS